MNKPHHCPVCQAPNVPYYFVTCKRCWKLVPSDMRKHFLGAWQRRIIDPAGHQEALAGVLLWCRDRRVKCK